MSHRQPTLKSQAELIRKAFENKGHSIVRGEALELAAHLNGYPSWNVAKQQTKRESAASSPDEKSRSLTLTIWVAEHYHRHGHDSFYFRHPPSEADVIERINELSSFENGEYIEILGSETFHIDLDEQLSLAASKEVKSPLIGVFEVLMTDVVDYEVPDLVPEWQWVQTHAAFHHKGNGVHEGVWEFMVHADKLRLNLDTAPTFLKPHIMRALEHGAAWMMFHQG